MDSLLIKALEAFGPVAGACAFFIWWGYHREKDLIIRLQIVEDYVREALSKLVTDNTIAIEKNTEVLELTSKTLATLPCTRPEFFTNICAAKVEG